MRIVAVPVRSGVLSAVTRWLVSQRVRGYIEFFWKIPKYINFGKLQTQVFFKIDKFFFLKDASLISKVTKETKKNFRAGDSIIIRQKQHTDRFFFGRCKRSSTEMLSSSFQMQQLSGLKKEEKKARRAREKTQQKTHVVHSASELF